MKTANKKKSHKKKRTKFQKKFKKLQKLIKKIQKNPSFQWQQNSELSSQTTQTLEELLKYQSLLSDLQAAKSIENKQNFQTSSTNLQATQTTEEQQNYESLLSNLQANQALQELQKYQSLLSNLQATQTIQDQQNFQSLLSNLQATQTLLEQQNYQSSSTNRQTTETIQEQQNYQILSSNLQTTQTIQEQQNYQIPSTNLQATQTIQEQQSYQIPSSNPQTTQTIQDLQSYQIPSKNIQTTQTIHAQQSYEIPSTNLQTTQTIQEQQNYQIPSSNLQATQTIQEQQSYQIPLTNLQTTQTIQEQQNYQIPSTNIQASQGFNQLNSQTSQSHQGQENHQTASNFQALQYDQGFQNVENPSINFPTSQNFQEQQNFQSSQNFQEQQNFQTSQNFQEQQNFQKSQNFQEQQSFQAPQNFQEQQNFQAPQNFQAQQNFQTSQNYQVQQELQTSQVQSFQTASDSQPTQNFQGYQNFNDPSSNTHNTQEQQSFTNTYPNHHLSQTTHEELNLQTPQSSQAEDNLHTTSNFHPLQNFGEQQDHRNSPNIQVSESSEQPQNIEAENVIIPLKNLLDIKVQIRNKKNRKRIHPTGYQNSSLQYFKADPTSLPRSINVDEFAEARAYEIKNLQLAMAEEKNIYKTLAIQSLPNHLRRRAASHDFRRLPSFLRDKALQEREKEQGYTTGLVSKLPKGQRKRKPKSVTQEYSRRSRKNNWLETHIWHAKRFKMSKQWGYTIAEKPNEKSFRACYRATAKSSLMQDQSYMEFIQLVGNKDKIIMNLNRMVAPQDQVSNNESFLTSKIYADMTFFHADQYPINAIGPIKCLWATTSDVNQSKIIFIVHPVISEEFVQQLVHVFNLEEQCGVEEENFDEESSMVVDVIDDSIKDEEDIGNADEKDLRKLNEKANDNNADECQSKVHVKSNGKDNEVSNEKDLGNPKKKHRGKAKKKHLKKANKKILQKTNEKDHGKANGKDKKELNGQDHGEPNEKDYGKENENDHGKENEKDYGKENENDHGKENEKDHGKENDNDHGKANEKDHGKANGKDKKELNGQDYGEPNEKDYGKENENDHGKENEKDYGKENENDHGKENEKDHGKENEKDHGKENDNDHGKANEKDNEESNGKDLGITNETDHGKANEKDHGKANKKDHGKAKNTNKKNGNKQEKYERINVIPPVQYSNLEFELLHYRLDFVMFSLTGPLSWSILQNVFITVEPNNAFGPEHLFEDTKMNFTRRKISFEEFSTNNCGIFNLYVEDPRINLPYRKLNPFKSISKSAKSLAQSFTNTSSSCLWDESIRRKCKSIKIPDHEINSMRSDMLLPTSEFNMKSSVIPVVVLQKPSLSLNDNYGKGFHVLMPPGWSMPFWVSMVYQGARVGGMRENDNMLRESSKFCFPINHCDTKAGKEAHDNMKEKKKAKHNGYPKDQRRNYDKLGIRNQFELPWNDLVKDWKRNVKQIISIDATQVEQGGEKISKLLEEMIKEFEGNVSEPFHKNSDVDLSTVNMELGSPSPKSEILDASVSKSNRDTSCSDSDMPDDGDIMEKIFKHDMKSPFLKILNAYSITTEVIKLQQATMIFYNTVSNTEENFENPSQNVISPQTKMGVDSAKKVDFLSKSQNICNTESLGYDGIVILRDRCILERLNSLLKIPFSTNDLIDVIKLVDRLPHGLIPVQVTSLKRGSPEDHSLICIPTENDITELRKFADDRIHDEEYLGPMEPMHKGLIKTFPFIYKTYDLMRYNAFTIGTNTRWIIGFVNSGQFSFRSGTCRGVGYLSLIGLFYFLLTCVNSKILLYRNIDSFQYRFCEVEVLTRL